MAGVLACTDSLSRVVMEIVRSRLLAFSPAVVGGTEVPPGDASAKQPLYQTTTLYKFIKQPLYHTTALSNNRFIKQPLYQTTALSNKLLHQQQLYQICTTCLHVFLSYYRIIRSYQFHIFTHNLLHCRIYSWMSRRTLFTESFT